MHGYRLTGRGKFILTMLVILSLAGVISLRKFAVASDKNGVYGSYLNSSHLYEEHEKPDLCQLASSFNAEINKSSEAYGGVFEAKEDFLSINAEEIKTYNQSKVVFLTFDDGPSENVTPAILDVLDEYEIKATFFVLGNMCEKNPDVLKDVYTRGHSIGNHSYTHNFKKLYKDEESFLNELTMTEDVIKQNLGDEYVPRLFRFPGGSFEDYKQEYMDVLDEKGYVSVDWNAVTGDAEVVSPTYDGTLERMKATVKGKSNVVLLMHDSATKHETVEALPAVIDYLKSQEYEFAIIK